MKAAATALVLILTVLSAGAPYAGPLKEGTSLRSVIDKAQPPFKFRVKVSREDPEPEAVDVIAPSGKKVQTIMFPADAQAPCDSCDLLVFKDLNFDGYNDLLMLTGWGTIGEMYDVWIYYPKRSLFQKVSFDTEFANPELDVKNKALITTSPMGCCEGSKYYYRYTNGKFSLFKEERYFMEGENDVSVVRELENGKWRVTGRGTSILTAKTVVGAGEGEIRVEFVRFGETPSSLIGQILVYHSSAPSPLQSLYIDVFRPSESPLRFEFEDLNDDGYQDLIFHNSRTGYASTAPGADVYLWVPTLRKFVQSKTLSQAGEITKSKEKGCVQIRTKCSSTAWGKREYCFNQETGRWKQVAGNRCRELSGD